VPAVWWNLAGWLAWGIFVVSLRYAAEQRHKLADNALRCNPWRPHESDISPPSRARLCSYLTIQLAYLLYVGLKWKASRNPER